GELAAKDLLRDAVGDPHELAEGSRPPEEVPDDQGLPAVVDDVQGDLDGAPREAGLASGAGLGGAGTDSVAAGIAGLRTRRDGSHDRKTTARRSRWPCGGAEPWVSSWGKGRRQTEMDAAMSPQWPATASVNGARAGSPAAA